MAKTNTKDFILAVSLELLNQNGEANITAVDLANELDISPGNLYYHYKGKGQIIKALLDRYDEAFQDAFPLVRVDQQSPIENWASLYVLMEQIYLYRFLFKNPNDMLSRYPELSRALGNLYLRLYNYIAAVLESVVDTNNSQFTVPTDMVALILTSWFNYREIVIPQGDCRLMIRSGMARLEHLLAPFCSGELRQAMVVVNSQY